MQLIGHATLDSLISAVEAIAPGCDRASEDRLEELRQQTDSMTEQLLRWQIFV
uniref:Transcriptional regulator n=1 Tax=Macrostomum lignano TaxID=282301 RepID=A0A1I8F6T8_9PLAT